MMWLAGWMGAVAVAAPDVAAETVEALRDLEVQQQVTVKDPGAKPRQKLKLKPKPGTVARFETKQRQNLTMSMTLPNGQTQTLPGGMDSTTTFVMRHEVGKALKDGTIPVSVVVEDLRAETSNPQVQAAVESALQPMKGLGYRILVDRKGTVAQVDVGLDDPQMQAAIQNLADQTTLWLSQYPLQPLGKGAELLGIIDMDFGFMALTAEQTGIITAMADDKVSADVSFTMKPKGTPDMSGMLPPGADVQVSEVNSTGSGQQTVDLKTLGWTGTYNIESDFVMSLSAEGQTMTMTMAIEQSVTSTALP
ncbi:MAG: hypothetical protein AAGA48_12930 [Myxococcota bacterium]